MKLTALSLHVGLLVIGLNAYSAEARSDAPSPSHQPLLQKLKSLKGLWLQKDGSEKPHYMKISIADDQDSVIQKYKGMVTTYRLKNDHLRMDHACIAGNMPRFALDEEKSTRRSLVFKLVGVNGLDPTDDGHMHHYEMRLQGPNKLVQTRGWTAQGAKPRTAEFVFERVEPKAANSLSADQTSTKRNSPGTP